MRARALGARSARWRWALLLGFLAVLASLRPSAAQPVLQQVATGLGVTVAVPASLRAAEGLAPFSDLPAQVEGLATFTDDRDEPLNIQVRKGAQHGWKSLPAANSSAAADWTQRFAVALQLPEAYDFKPGRYDPERGALSLEYKVLGPSFARLMQRLPDAHPLWGPTREAGEQPANAKCLIDALLAGQASASEAELRGRVPAASQACSLPEAMVSGYLQQLGAGEFAPSKIPGCPRCSTSSIAKGPRSAAAAPRMPSVTRRRRESASEAGWHRQKAEEAVARLEKWLRDNPTARPGDRAAAENVLKDLRNALGGK